MIIAVAEIAKYTQFPLTNISLVKPHTYEKGLSCQNAENKHFAERTPPRPLNRHHFFDHCISQGPDCSL